MADARPHAERITLRDSHRMLEDQCAKLEAELAASLQREAALQVALKGDEIVKAALREVLEAAERREADHQAILSDTEKWMAWCDYRVLERAEAAEARCTALEQNNGLLEGRLAASEERVASLKGALRKQTERACNFNCDADSPCSCPAHQAYREASHVY